MESGLLSAVAMPFLIFPVEQRWRVFLPALAPLLGILLLQLWAYDLVEPLGMSAQQLRWFGVSASLVSGLGLLVPLFLLMRLVVSTEGAMAEAVGQAEASSQAKNNFLGMVSHELRTPLNGLMGALDLIGSEPLSFQQRDHLEIARSTGGVLRAIVGDILEFSRLEEGGVILERRSLRLQAEVPRMLHPLRLQAETKGVSLRMQVSDDLPRVMVDSDRLRQILLHLVTNAIKFTEHGFVEVALRGQTSVGDGMVRLVLTVRDTGIGMTPDQQRELFNPFVQHHRDTHPNANGTGLGLALTRRVVRAMEGTIEVESRVGLGTVVSVHLGFEQASSLSPAPTAISPRDPLRVLLVEDEPVNRMVASKLLRKEGIEVVTAIDGAQGFDLWRIHRFPLVLMDCQMPVMDGYEATRKIRELEASLGVPKTRIVAYTANALSEDRRRCQECGMDGFLAKPVSRKELLEALGPGWAWNAQAD
ncbi:MAG: response regulator [Fibrobacteria bacterium]|nr:response regulator [Fibrobacteria bacterium]